MFEPIHNIEEGKERLGKIFDDLLPVCEHHPNIGKLKRYAVKLKKIGDIELGMMIMIDLMPQYLGNSMDEYVKDQICRKYDIELPLDIFNNIVDILLQMCHYYIN